MTLYMVVDREALPADVLPWEIFIENREVIDSSDLTLYINSLVDQTLCPPGKLVVMAIAPNMRPWPLPRIPSYRSEAYRAQKKREAERMLDQIEQHYPGFRQHIHTLIVGTPTTIERYLLKNGGAVGGPKNAIGQQMLKRLHARSEWKNLYFCGDSTVMATGAPATVVSGVGAANMVLRDLHKAEYDARRFPRQYVHFVDLPYRSPSLPSRTSRSRRRTPLGRRRNASGARRRPVWPGARRASTSPASCGAWRRRTTSARRACCASGTPWPRSAATPVRQTRPARRTATARALPERRCASPSCSAGCARLRREAGWLEPDAAANNRRIAVVGSSAAGLCCAYYLALMGSGVVVLDRHDQPGDRLWQAYTESDLPRAALERDLEGILRGNVHFTRGSKPGSALDIQELLGAYDAVYVAVSAVEFPQLGASIQPDAVDPSTAQVAGQPGVYAGGDFLRQGQRMVEAVADGRRAAVALGRYLRARQKGGASGPG